MAPIPTGPAPLHWAGIACCLLTMAGPLVPQDAQGPAQKPSPEPGYRLRAEAIDGIRKAKRIDVNLGHSPEAFVRAAHLQIHGTEPPPELLTEQAHRLRTDPTWRRIDVVHALGGRDLPKGYSDPWQSHPPRLDAPKRRLPREVGAVFMMFFRCGKGASPVNCAMGWANTHALGMDAPHPFYGLNGEPAHHVPDHTGYWVRELLDARSAGLSFLLPNVYGHEVGSGRIARLTDALEHIEAMGIRDGVKIGMFDDTWGWGRKLEPVPDFSDPRKAGEQIFRDKWRPWFDAIPERHWYRVWADGVRRRPLIEFYNGGTLPWEGSAQVLRHLKASFRKHYGVTPWLAVDGFFWRDPAMASVADSRFRWMTLRGRDAGKASRSEHGGVVLDHAMVRWDDCRSDSKTRRPDQLLIKGPEVLERVLKDTQDADLLVLATWNDLGEGTGIHRNYDYYHQGAWLKPDHFMAMIRASQERR